MNDDPQHYVTIYEAADITGIHHSTIRRHIKQGTLQIEMYGTVTCIHKKELRRWQKEDYTGKGKQSDKWKLDRLRKGKANN